MCLNELLCTFNAAALHSYSWTIILLTPDTVKLRRAGGPFFWYSAWPTQNQPCLRLHLWDGVRFHWNPDLEGGQHVRSTITVSGVSLHWAFLVIFARVVAVLVVAVIEVLGLEVQQRLWSITFRTMCVQYALPWIYRYMGEGFYMYFYCSIGVQGSLLLKNYRYHIAL